MKLNIRFLLLMFLAIASLTTPRAFASDTKPAGDLVVEIKQWARVQWHTLKAYWANGTSAAPGATPGSVAVVSGAGKSLPKTMPVPMAPRAPAQAAVMAAVQPAAPIANTVSAPVKGLEKSVAGVPVYDLKTADAIPKLNLEIEPAVSANRYRLNDRLQKLSDDRVMVAFDTPEILSNTEMLRLNKKPESAQAVVEIKDVVFNPKGRVSREAFDKIVMNLKNEPKIDLGKFKFLTAEELRFLSGLLLYQQGDKCAVALGLFHELSRAPGWQSEANFYLAMCSRKLGLATDFFERSRRVFDGMDIHYSVKLMKEIGADVPYEFVDGIGTALAKIAANPKFIEKLDETGKANLAYILTDYGASTDRFKVAKEWGPKVPATHPKSLNARFLTALAEYQVGSKAEAFRIQEQLISDTKTDKTKMEFQALVALNLGRMAFQERDFKKARESFMQVYKDHPLWLQSLTEMGWAQLMSEDFEGAIGNMYSIQSPFFANVYKPESYVIRTIGYLNLCQYGDAYRTLSHLETEYRPQLEKIDKFVATTGKKGHYETVRRYLQAGKDLKEVDGLPVTIIREMARHRNFTNLQKALNRQLDERPLYNSIDAEVERSLKRAQSAVNVARKNVELLKKRFVQAKTLPELQQNGFAKQLEKELANLNDLFFAVDLYTEARSAMPAYRKDVINGADDRLASLRSKTEQLLANRLLQMKLDLARALDNNELLRYEVFAGSGENIRFQVAGGDVAKRVSASTVPKSKSLHWDFDGEYWEDEIGNYRSSLKNNCPTAHGQKTAANDGV